MANSSVPVYLQIKFLNSDGIFDKEVEQTFIFDTVAQADAFLRGVNTGLCWFEYELLFDGRTTEALESVK